MHHEFVDWALCRSFLAILREGSLSGAARWLRLTHPTIRRHLHELETAVGAPLFLRSQRGLIATDLARELQPAAETMEAGFQQFMRIASAERGAASGTVRITASEIIGSEVLPLMLASLKDRYPDLSFDLHLTDKVEDIQRRDADIAVRMVRPSESALVARRVGIVALGLYAHRRWIETHGEPESLETLLNGGSLIDYEREPIVMRTLVGSDVVLPMNASPFRSDSNLAQLAAVKAGLGVGVCQLPLAARQAELRRVLPAMSHDMEIWLVTHPGLLASMRIRVTMDALADGLGAYASGR